MTAASHPTEQGPGRPLSAPLAASTPEVGTRGGSKGEFGPQTGAQGFDTDPRPLTDAELLAWAVVIEYRQLQHISGITILLLPFPPCPTCQATVYEATAWWQQDTLRNEVTLDLKPCGHSHTSSRADVERIYRHLGAMLQALETRLPTTDEIVQEARARAGEPEAATVCIHPEGYDGECPCPTGCGCCPVTAAVLGPIGYARRQQAERAAAAPSDPEAAVARIRAYAQHAIDAGDTGPGPDIGQLLMRLLDGDETATQATGIETTARVFAGLHRSAEQDVTRVIELYERWVKQGAPPLGVPIARWWDKRLVELHDAINPSAPDGGPTVAEAAQADRNWDLERHGE
ncbi:hypothetical protein [Streptomyces sp. NPDC060027]|uniref:hypothetical protein n=1 Tax=Streptomyces sp. NPDC060027 TaxID=3347040 RepID=UPI0036B70430